jgi:hypothetical protein
LTHPDSRSLHPTPHIVASVATQMLRMTLQIVWHDSMRNRSSSTPRNKDLFAASAPPRLAAKAPYLIRDTMKALGYSEEAPAPTVACFMVDLADTDAGGTGHTIRVCRQAGVPVAFQNDWAAWIAELEDPCRQTDAS